MSAKSVPLPAADGVAQAAGSVNGVKTVQRLMGWSVRETAGAVASCVLREGTVSGKIIGAIQLAANASSTEWFGPMGILVNDDIFYDNLSGTIAGVVYVA